MVCIAIILSIIGAVVQKDWGDALFPQSVRAEQIKNAVLIGMGLCICILFKVISRLKGSKAALIGVSVVTGVLLILASFSVASFGNGIRLVLLGPIIIRFSLLIPLAYILIVSFAISRLEGQSDYYLFFTVVTITLLMTLTSEALDSADRLWYLLPWIGYVLMFPRMKEHIWYYWLPLVFIAAYASQIAYVWFNEDEHIISYRGRVIAAWLYPDSEVYKDTNYFPLQLREMVKSGGILGNKAAFSTDSISYRDGSGLLLVGLFQRFGFLGFAAISALTAVLCRQIWRIASTQLRKGNTYQATVCRGICIFFALSGGWSVISYLYILPMTSMFDYPFLCVNGFLPVWFLCLAAALSTTDTYSQPFKKDQMN